MSLFEPLTDLQWQALETLFPVPAKRSRGKPHTPWRAVVNSILFILLTGAKWEALPKSPEYASKSAAHRWYKIWKANGVLDQMLARRHELSGMVSNLIFPPTRQRLPKAQPQEFSFVAE
jgi:transposase